jgi:hypothetical protein
MLSKKPVYRGWADDHQLLVAVRAKEYRSCPVQLWQFGRDGCPKQLGADMAEQVVKNDQASSHLCAVHFASGPPDRTFLPRTLSIENTNGMFAMIACCLDEPECVKYCETTWDRI